MSTDPQRPAPVDPDVADGGPRVREQAGRLRQQIVPSDPRTVGDEPDYRFTLANERTFLAWVRTALALAAGGLGAIALLPDLDYSEYLGLGLLVLSFLMAASAYRRWANNERAMRLGEPLTGSRLPIVMAVGTALFALVAAVLFVISPP